MDKLKLALTWVAILGIIALGLFWISENAEKIESEKIEAMSHGYDFSKGVILEKHSYKGRTIQVKYRIDGVEYEYSGGWDNNPRNIDVGDSIWFKYSIDNPRLIITELDDNY